MVMLIERGELQKGAVPDSYQLGFDQDSKRFAIYRNGSIVAWVSEEESKNIVRFANRCE